MHRFRSWTLDPPEWRTQRNRALSLEGGDGSALNVDFTTGVLDPKITHTRGSNATFINSSGRVEWAAANMLRNTVWNSTSLPTGWLANAGNTGTVTYNGDGTITCAATNQIAWIYPNFPYIVTQSGLSYIFSFRVVSISGPMLITDILSTGNLSGADYFIDGISVGTIPSAPSGNVTGPCVISVRVNATSTSWFPRLGVGVQRTNRTLTITMSEPHAHPGTVPVPYIANSSTSAENFNTPRFDYNPTTLESNGLLIEGNVSNLITYSDASTTGWTGLNVTGSNNNATSPDGTTSATLWTGIGGSSNRAYSTTFNVTSGSTYTVSAWFKKPASNGSRYVKIYLLSSTESAIGWPSNGVLDLDTGTASGTGFTVTAYKDNWYRVVSTGTVTSTTSARAFIAMCTSTGGLLTTTESMLAWGCQVEAGSGASSYIPTGASTGNRAADVCYMDGTNFSSWYNASTQTGTLFADITHSALSGANSGIELGAGLGNQVASNRVSLRRDVVIVDGVSSLAVAPNGASQRFQTAIAFAPGTGNTATCRNGGTVSNPAQAAGTLSGINALKLYVDSNLYPYGWIRQVKVWPTNLPNATLKSITTI